MRKINFNNFKDRMLYFDDDYEDKKEYEKRICPKCGAVMNIIGPDEYGDIKYECPSCFHEEFE